MNKISYRILTPINYEFTGEYHRGRRIYILLSDVKFELNHHIITIPTGFKWDGWTIPRVIDLFFDLMKDPVPALLHDFLYLKAGTMPISRLESDLMLKEFALARKNQRREVLIAYRAVRIFSGFIWIKYVRRNSH